MRVLIGVCTSALLLGAAPAHADPGAGDSLAQRAEAAAAQARIAARVSSAQVNATAAFLIPLRINNPRIGRSFGFDVVDSKTGESVYSTSANTALRPASNMKIVTALTALKVLGPSTRMATSTFVPKRGKVILRGGGDTMLTSSSLASLARSTAAYLTSNRLRPGRRQPPAYRPSTCTINGKTRKSTTKRPCPLVTPPKKRKAVKVFVDDSLYRKPSRGPGWTSSYQPSVVRPVRPLGRIGVYQWDSAKEAGAVFASALRSAGLKARIRGHRDVTEGTPEAASVDSSTVASQVRYMLQVSENNIAEMLFRQVAVERGRKGSWKGGRLAARDTLRELGLSTKSLKLLDGSGVSRDDRLTPRFLTDLLAVALRTDEHPEFESFLKSLPVGGRTGTLSPSTARFTTYPSRCAAGEVFAKTGTLFDTIGLSGYTRAADGELKIFSALVNDRPQSYSPLSTRQAVDGLIATVNGCWGPTKKTGNPPPLD
jgi:D-alanyl-D-alanine carboxypeptidase/D-alanyl-D-alanine-endopeptidase (penicillin-binding protein 4)